MGRLKDLWNKQRFSVYDSEEKNTLKLIENINNFVSDDIVNEIDNKTDKNGNHLGSWQGLNKPTLSEEGMRATVETMVDDTRNLLNENCYIFNGSEIKIPNTHLEVYNYYDNLVNSYPSYINSTLLGTDILGNEIKAYTFTTPLVTNNVGERVDRGTILLTCCIHGDERSPSMQLYYFLKEMMESKPPSILHQLKSKYRIKVIPICNPSGYDLNTRQNSNGVDLARNFNANWELHGAKGDYEYSGETVASERETQIIQDYINTNIATEILIDIHNTAQGSNEYMPGRINQFTWINTPTDNSYRAKQLRNIYQTSIMETSSVWSNRHAELDKNIIFGMYNHFNLPGIADYGLKSRINSMQLELPWKCSKLDDEKFSYNTMRIGIELIGNMLINTFKQLPLLNEDISFLEGNTTSITTVENGGITLIPIDTIIDKTNNVSLSYSGVVVPKGFKKANIRLTTVYDKTLSGVFENRVYIAETKDDRTGVNNEYDKDVRYITGAPSLDRTITSNFTITDLIGGNVLYFKTTQISGSAGNLIKAYVTVFFE